MQHREDDLQRRDTHLRMDAARDALAVVLNRNRSVGQKHHVDLGASARQRLVDRVIDDLVNQVVQAYEDHSNHGQACVSEYQLHAKA